MVAAVVVGVNVVEVAWTASAAVEDTDHASAAFCAIRAYKGENSCWTQESECASRGIECQIVQRYACFSGTAQTNEERSKWCFPTYGECSRYRDEVQRDREYTDVNECTIYRTTPI